MNHSRIITSRILSRRGLAGLTAAVVATFSPVIGCSTGRSHYSKTPGPSGPAFIIQSHRGAGKLAPENTTEAFKLAWRLGTVPEADVRTTSDGEPVAFHDAGFGRLVKDAPPELRNKGVHDLTWSELAKLDVGSWKGCEFAGQRVPRIRDVFAIMHNRPERWLYLDVKDVPLERLAALAREYGVASQVILASTRYEQLLAWKKLLPDSQTLLWMGEPEARLVERLQVLRVAGFEGISQLQIHVQVVDLNASDLFRPSSRFLRAVATEIRPLGICFQVLPRGHDDVEVYQRLMDLGVESFATDDPKTALEAVRNYRQRGPQ